MIDKTSSKEQFDNRDLTALYFELKDKYDSLPNREELIRLYDLITTSLRDPEHIMYDNQTCSVTVQHTFAVAPLVVGMIEENHAAVNKIYVDKTREILLKSMEDLSKDLIDKMGVLTKDVETKISNLKDEVLLLDGDSQTVASNVEFSGDVSFTGDISINPEKIKTSNIALTDKTNTFTAVQTFRAAIDASGESIICGSLSSGSLSSNSGIFKEHLGIDSGGYFQAPQAYINKLYIAGKDVLLNPGPEYMFVTKGSAQILGNLHVGDGSEDCHIKVGGNVYCNILDAKTLGVAALAVTKLECTNAVVGDELKSTRIIGGNIYVQHPNEQECEVIDTLTHYIFEGKRPRGQNINTNEVQLTDFVMLKDVAPQGLKGKFVQTNEANVFVNTNTFTSDTIFNVAPKVSTSNPLPLLDDNQLITFGQTKATITEIAKPISVKILSYTNDYKRAYINSWHRTELKKDYANIVSVVGDAVDQTFIAFVADQGITYSTRKDKSLAYIDQYGIWARNILKLVKDKVGSSTALAAVKHMFGDDAELESVPNTSELYAASRLFLTNFSTQDTVALPESGLTIGPLSGRSANLGMVSFTNNRGNQDLIPAYVSYYPYADPDGDTAIVFAQEDVTYNPEGPSLDYNPGHAVPKCLVGDTLINQGINVITNVASAINKGWYSNANEAESIFVVSPKGDTKYGGRNGTPIINMAADVTIHPEIPAPGNIKLPSHFDINTQCCVRLPANMTFRIRPLLQSYQVDKFGVGTPNYANESNEDDIISVVYSEENGFWDFICTVGAYLKHGLEVGVKIAEKLAPVIKAAVVAFGNEERAQLTINSDLVLEPFIYANGQIDQIPKVSLASASITQKVLATPGVAWSLKSFSTPTRNGRKTLLDNEDLIQVLYSPENFDPWGVFTKIQAFFQKALKVVNLIENTYYSTLEIINEPTANGEYEMPTLNMAGNIKISGQAHVVEDGVHKTVPTTHIINGKTYYTYNAQAADDTEVATHAYVLAHSGGDLSNCVLKNTNENQDITGEGEVNFEKPARFADITLRHEYEDGNVDLLLSKGKQGTPEHPSLNVPNLSILTEYEEEDNYIYDRNRFFRDTNGNLKIAKEYQIMKPEGDPEYYHNYIEIGPKSTFFGAVPIVDVNYDNVPQRALITKEYADEHYGGGGGDLSNCVLKDPSDHTLAQVIRSPITCMVDTAARAVAIRPSAINYYDNHYPGYTCEMNWSVNSANKPVFAIENTIPDTIFTDSLRLGEGKCALTADGGLGKLELSGRRLKCELFNGVGTAIIGPRNGSETFTMGSAFSLVSLLPKGEMDNTLEYRHELYNDPTDSAYNDTFSIATYSQSQTALEAPPSATEIVHKSGWNDSEVLSSIKHSTESGMHLGTSCRIKHVYQQVNQSGQILLRKDLWMDLTDTGIFFSEMPSVAPSDEGIAAIEHPNQLTTKQYVDETTAPKYLQFEEASGNVSVGSLEPDYVIGQDEDGNEQKELIFNFDLFGLGHNIGLRLRRIKNRAASNQYKDEISAICGDGNEYTIWGNNEWYTIA